MCGRFVGFRKVEELRQYFPIDETACEVSENYNVAPSQEVLAIVRREGANWLDKFHWGLVPFWAKDISIGNKMINARSESIASKPSFRNAFKKRRCLILADGFYEWMGKKGEKQPVFITLPDNTPFAFAGLWESWKDKNSDNALYKSCTIITTAASDSVKKIHHRMPAILRPAAYDQWLNPDNNDTDLLTDLLKEKIVMEFTGQPVSKQVNSARNNDASNIKPLKQIEINFR